MSQKSPTTTNKKEVSAQEICRQFNMGRLRFFFAFLAYMLFLAVLLSSGASGTGGGNMWNSFVDILTWVPLAFLVSARLVNAGYRWWIGIACIGVFFQIIKAALKKAKYGYDSEPAIFMLVIFALIIAVLLALPPKRRKSTKTPPAKIRQKTNGQ